MKYLILLALLVSCGRKDVDQYGVTKLVHTGWYANRNELLPSLKEEVHILCLKNGYTKSNLLKSNYYIKKRHGHTAFAATGVGQCLKE